MFHMMDLCDTSGRAAPATPPPSTHSAWPQACPCACTCPPNKLLQIRPCNIDPQEYIRVVCTSSNSHYTGAMIKYKLHYKVVSRTHSRLPCRALSERPFLAAMVPTNAGLAYTQLQKVTLAVNAHCKVQLASWTSLAAMAFSSGSAWL